MRSLAGGVAPADTEADTLVIIPHGPPGLVRTIKHSDAVPCVVFKPDGRQLLFGAKGNIVLWDIVAGRMVRKYAAGEVLGLALTPDADTLSAGVRTRDWLFGTWPMDGWCTRSTNHRPRFSSPRPPPDGRLAVTGDGNIRVWRLPESVIPTTADGDARSGPWEELFDGKGPGRWRQRRYEGCRNPGKVTFGADGIELGWCKWEPELTGIVWEGSIPVDDDELLVEARRENGPDGLGVDCPQHPPPPPQGRSRRSLTGRDRPAAAYRSGAGCGFRNLGRRSRRAVGDRHHAPVPEGTATLSAAAGIRLPRQLHAARRQRRCRHRTDRRRSFVRVLHEEVCR